MSALDVYVLRGAGCSTVQAYPSQVHPTSGGSSGGAGGLMQSRPYERRVTFLPEDQYCEQDVILLLLAAEW